MFYFARLCERDINHYLYFKALLKRKFDSIMNEFTNVMVDNFDLLSNYLFEYRRTLIDDEFYFLQIIVRGKDGNHVSGNNKNRLVKYYVIRSKEQLLGLKDEIIGICHAVNGRAYIHPTRRSLKEVANNVLENTARTFVSQNWIGLRSVYSTAAGQSYVSGDKQFIVDLDNFTLDQVKEVFDFVNTLRGRKDDMGNISQLIVPTKHGYHLITNAFDVSEFTKVYPEIDIHKNNPTLLYYKS